MYCNAYKASLMREQAVADRRPNSRMPSAAVVREEEKEEIEPPVVPLDVSLSELGAAGGSLEPAPVDPKLKQW